jgi:hypothetical protein
VIEGFKIEVTAEEVGRHLETRIRYHRERASECLAKAKRVEQVDQTPDEDEEATPMAVCWPGYVHELERRAAHHSAREMFLIFARDHIVANQLYRLGEEDLATLEWLPMSESLRAV